jgi:hypothetical protein
MSPRCAAPSSTSRSSAKRSPELSTQRNRLISAGSFCVALSLSNEMRTTVCRAIGHAIAASSSVGIQPGFLPPLACSAILYGFANSKGSKRPELDGIQGREPRHSDFYAKGRERRSTPIRALSTGSDFIAQAMPGCESEAAVRRGASGGWILGAARLKQSVGNRTEPAILLRRRPGEAFEEEEAAELGKGQAEE